MFEAIAFLAIVAGVAAVALLVSAFVMTKRASDELTEMQRRWFALHDRVASLEREVRDLSEGKTQAPPTEAAAAAPEAPAPAPEPVVSEHRAQLPPWLAATPVEPEEEPAPAEQLAAAAQAVPEPPPAKAAAEQWAEWEDVIGKRWMTWAGMAVMFIAAAFFVKYAYDQGWLGRIGPAGRVSIGVLFGRGLIGAGARFIRAMRAFGQGLIGGGLAIVYVSLFAGYQLYELMPQPVAFAFMVVACAGGMTLAVVHDALPIAVLATLGGFVTPIMVSTGVDARDALFAYLVLLDVGVVGVALFKRWAKLHSVAFVGTWVLFGGWYDRFYTDVAMGPTLAWIAGFYFIFLALPFVYHLRRRENTTVGLFVLSLLNATLTFTFLWRALGGYGGHKHVLGLCAIGMSACCVAMAAAFRKRVPDDARALFGFAALSVVLLTLAVPCHLGLHGITFAWALEAAALASLGYCYDYRPVRIGGFAVLVLTAVRVALRHWPQHHGAFALVFNRDFITALSLPVAAWLYAGVHQLRRKAATEADWLLKLVSAIGGGFAALLLTHAEFASWFELGDRPDLSACAAAVIWAVGASAFLGAGMWLRSVHARWAAFFALAVALGWTATGQFVAVEGSPWLLLSPRFVCSLFVVATVFGFAYVYGRFKGICSEVECSLEPLLWIAAGYFLLTVMSLEIHRSALRVVWPLARARWFAYPAITVLWAAGACVFVAIGIQARSFAARCAALVALFIAGSMCVHLHLLADPPAAWLLFSPRFLVTLVVVVAAFAYALSVARSEAIESADEHALAGLLWWAAIVALWLSLSVEVHSHFMRSVRGGAQARWIAQMSLSILWGLYATALLCIGFWQRLRALRFVALGLFLLTALKLLAVDMATVEMIYRIAAFFVIGLLMVGAAYLYHRLQDRVGGKG